MKPSSSVSLDLERICVGRFSKPFGIKGEILLISFTEDPLQISLYKGLELDDGTPLQLEAIESHKKMWRVRIKGYNSRTAVEPLGQKRIYVPRSHFADLDEEDNFYCTDLIGLPLQTLDEGVEVGRITAIHNFGAGDILDIQTPAKKSIYLPFTKAVIPVVNLQKGIVFCEKESIEIFSTGEKKKEKEGDK